MTRDPNRIDPILARLRGAWIKRPDLRLGQLLAGSLAIGGAEDRFNRMFQAECDEFGAANAPIAWPPVDRPAPTATPATVGGLLAAAPVGAIVEFVDCAFWYQARVHVDDSVEWYETRRRHATDARWMPWKRGIPPVRPSARLVPAAEADADPNQRGPLPKGG